MKYLFPPPPEPFDVSNPFRLGADAIELRFIHILWIIDKITLNNRRLRLERKWTTSCGIMYNIETSMVLIDVNRRMRASGNRK